MEAAHLPASPSSRLQALAALRAQLQGVEASVELLECLAAQLPSVPDSSLFADVGSAPAAPSDQAQAAAWGAAAAAHLQLLAELVARLDAVALGMEALAASGSSEAAAGPPGSLRIEELDAAAPTTRLPAALVLATALFGSSDAELAPLRPWAAEPAAAAAQQLLAALASKLAGVLEQRRQEGQQTSSQPGALLLEVSTTTKAAASTHTCQPEAVQQLLALAMQPVVQQLRPVLAAKVEHSKHKSARLEPYTGPGEFERCVAAGQLAWLLRQLSGRQLSAATSAAMPLLLQASEDPFPPVQACALWSLQHRAAAGQAGDLKPHARLLLPAVKRGLEGASDAAFPAAAAAAIDVVARLEGPNPYARSYHDVMTILLGEGELGGHNPERAAAWLAAAPPLFPRLGLQLASHFSRLMPLLLGWCRAPQQHVRLAALAALLEAIRMTWPRIPVHTAVLWGVLRRVHSEETQCSTVIGSAEQGPATVAAAAVDCALALWFAGGTAFQSELMTAKGSAQDELLQAVMQRLEECAEEEQEAAGPADAAQQEQQAQQPLVQML
ncbi:ARM repeat superfamily [Chlorella sorokiniana]|uniref:ARM repeat superfamily n=1 Tax=Chlorella sorokiniana TaxID=3076 RepID=A0A2P6TIT6_CHLSO|nr:ARM repeat superfamily [Chlorella sorokiniana]|eukprot:PRW39156.1 ARM repeat superfamily [Chlorella sorokiniana]